MNTYKFLVFSGFAIIATLLLYPTVRSMVNQANTTGFLPIIKASVIFLPYAFLLFLVYAIYNRKK